MHLLRSARFTIIQSVLSSPIRRKAPSAPERQEYRLPASPLSLGGSRCNGKYGQLQGHRATTTSSISSIVGDAHVVLHTSSREVLFTSVGLGTLQCDSNNLFNTWHMGHDIDQYIIIKIIWYTKFNSPYFLTHMNQLQITSIRDSHATWLYHNHDSSGVAQHNYLLVAFPVLCLHNYTQTELRSYTQSLQNTVLCMGRQWPYLE